MKTAEGCVPNVLMVEDGDTISIIAKLEPSVSDPALSVPGVAQSYRVVANSFGPTLTLVPLTDKITKLSSLPSR